MMSAGRIEYEASYDKAYEQAMNSLCDCGFRVNEEDRETGEIDRPSRISSSFWRLVL